MIPDVYHKQQVKEMMAVLLDRLGFGAAFAVQVIRKMYVPGSLQFKDTHGARKIW